MHAIFDDLIAKNDVYDKLYVDSFGINPPFIGCDMTLEMQKLLAERGISFRHKAQIFEDRVFSDFDMVVVATNKLKNFLIERGAPKEKIHLLTEFCPRLKGLDIPDPYKKGAEGYPIVFAMIEEACLAFFEKLRDNMPKKA